MSSVSSPVTHIRVDAQGCAWIEGTGIKVVEVALDRLADGLSPEEICLQHHGLLTLAQVHAALAYYYDHQQQLDAEIESQVQRVDGLRAKAGESPVVQRLKAKGKLA